MDDDRDAWNGSYRRFDDTHMHARPPSRRLPATPPGIRTENACVCFGILGADSEFVRNLVLDLKESGLATPSWTTLNGEAVVRYAIVNHRTTVADTEVLWMSSMSI